MNNRTNNDSGIEINRNVTPDVIEKRKKIKSAQAKKKADWLGLEHRSEHITLRVTPSLKKIVFDAAEKRGLTTSEYVTQILEVIVSL